MGTLDDRIARLERQFRPPGDASEHGISPEAARDLDALAAIVRDSRELPNVLARVQEQHPELDHYTAQLLAKRTVIRAAPDGERLWRLLASATDADAKLAHVREDRF